MHRVEHIPVTCHVVTKNGDIILSIVSEQTELVQIFLRPGEIQSLVSDLVNGAQDAEEYWRQQAGW